MQSMSKLFAKIGAKRQTEVKLAAALVSLT
jgi:hypothetical protein